MSTLAVTTSADLFEMPRSATPASRRAERDAAARGHRASASSSPTTWSASRSPTEQRLARPARRAVRPAAAVPADRRPALRPGDLRGAQGVPARRRLRVDVPAAGQRRAVRAVRPAAGAARAARGGLPRLDRGARAHRRRVGARARRRACTCGRSCTPRSRSSACAPRSRSSTSSSPRRSARTSRAASSPSPIWVDQEFHRVGAGRHGRGQVRRQLRRRACCRSRTRYDKGFEQVCFLDAVDQHPPRGARRHERLRRERRRLGRDAAGVRLDPRGRARARRSSSCWATRATRSPSVRSRSRRCGPGSRTARSPRCSRAARLRSSPRSVGSRATTSTSLVGDGAAGAVTTRVRAELTDIQYGRATDRHSWLHRLA